MRANPSSPLPRCPRQRTLTNKTIRRPTRKRRLQILNGRIRTQRRQRQCPQKVKDIPNIHPPPIRHKPSHHPLEPAI